MKDSSFKNVFKNIAPAVVVMVAGLLGAFMVYDSYFTQTGTASQYSQISPAAGTAFEDTEGAFTQDGNHFAAEGEVVIEGEVDSAAEAEVLYESAAEAAAEAEAAADAAVEAASEADAAKEDAAAAAEAAAEAEAEAEAAADAAADAETVE